MAMAQSFGEQSMRGKSPHLEIEAIFVDDWHVSIRYISVLHGLQDRQLRLWLSLRKVPAGTDNIVSQTPFLCHF
jgi:hypothetical protein